MIQEIANPTPEPLFYILINGDIPPVVRYGKLFTENTLKYNASTFSTLETYSLITYVTEAAAEQACIDRLIELGAQEPENGWFPNT